MDARRTKYLKLNDIEAYRISFTLSNFVWDVIKEWGYFSKKTIGAQFVDAVDSISANIAEGFGRYTKKDKIRFYRINFASMYESLDWNEKAKVRKLLSDDDYNHIFNELQKLPNSINSLINYTDSKLKL
ncbi:MAG: four helix bundle protein [Ignavibacteria bacterium]|jgi:four helix bundle protein